MHITPKVTTIARYGTLYHGKHKPKNVNHNAENQNAVIVNYLCDRPAQNTASYLFFRFLCRIDSRIEVKQYGKDYHNTANKYYCYAVPQILANVKM